LSKDKMKLFEDLMSLMAPEANFNKLRRHLHQNISPPCIPYLGMYLTDLTFIEEGNPDMIGELINFDKRRRVAVVIKEIQGYQQDPYCLKEVPIIRGFLLAGGEYVDENKCYKLSVDIEPRDGKAKQVSRSWRKSSAVKKKEVLEKRSINSLYVSERDTRKSKPIIGSAKGNAKGGESTKLPPAPAMKNNSEVISLDDLVDSLMEGNHLAVEQYLDSLDRTENEKDLYRVELVRLFDERMAQKGAEKLNFFESPDQEADEIPFEQLSAYLRAGNIHSFDAFFEGMEIYEAERIREQAIKLYEEGL